MASPRRRERSFRQNGTVNVTPLVDVMLVLLIIFMVTAPMMTVGVKVDLPQTSTAQLNSENEPLIVSIDAEGKIYVQETKIEKHELIDKLKAILGSNKNACVYVRGDKNLKYSIIMNVISHIAESGISKVSLMADASKNE
jgi:biopolymer transport protein TolR